MTTRFFQLGRRRFLGRGARLAAAAVVAGPLALATVAAERARAVGRAAIVLCSGRGPAVPQALLIRGCSALATAVQSTGGTLPAGLAIDFRKSVACLVTGAAPDSLAIDGSSHRVTGSAAARWALIGIARQDAGGPWRLAIGGADRPIRRETAIT